MHIIVVSTLISHYVFSDINAIDFLWQFITYKCNFVIGLVRMNMNEFHDVPALHFKPAPAVE